MFSMHRHGGDIYNTVGFVWCAVYKNGTLILPIGTIDCCTSSQTPPWFVGCSVWTWRPLGIHLKGIVMITPGVGMDAKSSPTRWLNPSLYAWEQHREVIVSFVAMVTMVRSVTTGCILSTFGFPARDFLLSMLNARLSTGVFSRHISAELFTVPGAENATDPSPDASSTGVHSHSPTLKSRLFF